MQAETTGARAAGYALGLCGVVVLLALNVAMMVMPAVAPAGGCANEALRAELRSSELPDCRAYELVTPPYKSGYTVTARAKTADGSNLIFESLGAYAGVESNNVLGPFYESTRTGAGWSTSPLSPSAVQFPASEYVDSGVDLQRTLWQLHTREQAFSQWSYYIREPSGAFVRIGPEGYPPTLAGPSSIAGSPAGAYAGASSDLAHIFFTLSSPTAEGSPRPLWPGDATQFDNSLYEYAGTNDSEPKLVAITNAGPIASNAEAHLIGDCGAEIGGPSGSTYNAVSESGATVFFTVEECAGAPPVREVYARVNGSQTVRISEPSPADCAGCGSAGGVAPGTFEGASLDGSKAFFLSSQDELLPGAHGENLYEYDFDLPRPERVLQISHGASSAEVQGVVRISPDGSHVYFVAKGVLTPTPNPQGVAATPGRDNLYLFERDAQFPQGRMTFVATVRPSDEECAQEQGEGLEEACLQDEEVWSGRDQGREATITADGRYLLFASSVDLTKDDTSKIPQLFLYDAVTGSLTRVSIGQAGFNDNGNTNNEAYTPRFKAPNYVGQSSPSQFESAGVMSSDGAYVTFVSSNQLTPRALLGHRNVYLYHAGQLSLISDGQDTAQINSEPAVSSFGMSEAGRDVFFTTADSLIPVDGDTQRDIYDARIEGGFPTPFSAPACSGPGCRGQVPEVPSFPSLASTQPASGDAAPDGLPPTNTPVRILGYKVIGSTIVLRIEAPGSGRLTGAGAGLSTARQAVRGAGVYRVKLALSSRERRLLKAKRRVKLRARVDFVSTTTGGASSAAIKVMVRR